LRRWAPSAAALSMSLTIVDKSVDVVFAALSAQRRSSMTNGVSKPCATSGAGRSAPRTEIV